MGRSEYELTAWSRRAPLMLAVLVLATAGRMVGAGFGRPAREVALGIVTIVSGVGLTVRVGGFVPHRVVIDDEGVVLVARLRTTAVPWGDLVGLSHGRFDFGGDQLRWERRSGRAITTSGRFAGLEEMVGDIAGRALGVLAARPGRRPVGPEGGRTPAG